MSDSGFADELDSELESSSQGSNRFSSGSRDFRQVMQEMFPSPRSPPPKTRASERWSRLRHQATVPVMDTTNGDDSVFLPAPSVHSTPRSLAASKRSKSTSRLVQRSSTRSLLSDCADGSPTQKLSSVSWNEAEVQRQKLQDASEKGWNVIKRYIEDKKFEHQTSQATMSWAMIRQHIFHMTDMERTRKDLYQRYGIIPRLNNDGTYTTSNVMLSPRSRHSVTRNKSHSSVGFLLNS